MNYDYSFTNDELLMLYNELKLIINSDEYIMLIKEYNKLIIDIVKNIENFKIRDPFSIAYLLKKNIEHTFNNNHQNSMDLDVLYKLWGSRVCTTNYSNRHLVSFINDILIKSGFTSCKILTHKEIIDIHSLSSLIGINRNYNYFLLCLIINNKKVFFDVDNNLLLKINKLISSGDCSCYLPIINNDSIIYFVNNNYDCILDVNRDYLFTLNSYIYSSDCDKKDFGSKLFLEDSMCFLDDYDIDLLSVNHDNISIISSLNEILSLRQNEIYKKVKKL